MFGLFEKKRKMSMKELYAPVLDEMWVCVIRFRPWIPEEHAVSFKKVSIKLACANKNGIYVESDDSNPFDFEERISGYIDKITSSYGHWVGFFETKEAAERAYDRLMREWISVIESKLVGEEG